jgi:hypothetical protein
MLTASKIMGCEGARNARTDDRHICSLGQVVGRSMAKEDLGRLAVPK